MRKKLKTRKIILGIILVLAGVFKLGKLTAFIPMPVISGFTSGIAIIIALGQLDNFFGVTSVGEYAFYNITGYRYSKLTQITFGSTVKKIGKYAFMGCTSLTEIVIPDAVSEIGEDAFRHCSALCRPTLSEKMKSQENEEFWGHIGFGDENGCVVKDGVFVKYVGPIDVVTVSEGVTEIPERTLGVSGRLHKYPNEYRLPQSLKVIHEHSFGHTYDKINLPSGYLQTQDTLPAK